jgi:hypothetical protein
MSATLVVTNQTFLRVCGWLTAAQKQNWTVILDEAFTPLNWHPFLMGKGSQTQKENWDKFHQHFQFEDHPEFPRRELVVPAEGRRDQVQAMAKADWETAGDQQRPWAGLAADTLDHACDTEVVDRQDGHLDIVSVTTPDAFAGFREVVFLTALFEWTLLHAVWSSLGVTFQRHEGIESNISRDQHSAQGPYLRIGHVLHPSDSATKRTLQRHAETGKPTENRNNVPLRSQVIQRAIDQAEAKFAHAPAKKTAMHEDPEPGADYLLQINAALGFDERPSSLPDRGKHIGGDVRGIDSLGHFENLAAFAVMNPQPRYRRWLEERFGLSDAQIDRAFRIHPLYQAVGRMLRDPACTYPKTVLLLSEQDASILHEEVFTEAQWIGQVGDLPSFTETTSAGRPGRPRKSGCPEYQRLRLEEEKLRKKSSRGTASPSEIARLEVLRAAKRSLSGTQ